MQPHSDQLHSGFVTGVRPIDNRWQPSRGIQFSEGRDQVLSGLTRVPCSGIRFSDVRHASTKAASLPRSAYQSSANSKTSTASRSDTSHKNTAFNFVSVGGSVADLKINQQKLQTENERLANDIKDARQELDDLKLQIVLQADKASQELGSEVKRWMLEVEGLKEINKENQVRIKAQQQDWDIQLQLEREIIERSFRDEIATKTRTVSTLQDRLDTLKKEQNQAYTQSRLAAEESVADREIEREVEHHQTILKLRTLQAESEGAQDAAKKARNEVDRRLKLERDRFSQQLYRRDVERSVYDRYNAHFTQFHDVLWEFLPTLNSKKRMETGRLRGSESQRQKWENFMDRVPTFPQKYSQVYRNVVRLMDGSQTKTEQTLHVMESQLAQLNKERRALQVEGHRSRYTTRRLRYNSFAGDALYDIISSTATDTAIQLQKDHWKAVEKDSRAQILLAKSPSKRVELKNLEKQATVHMQSLHAIGTCIKKSRKVQVLRDLLRDPHEYKRAFIASASASEQIEDAMRDWRRYSTLRRSELDRMHSGSDLDRLAVEFANKYRAAVLASEAFQSLVHRLALLETELNDISLRDTDLDTQIEGRIGRLIESYPMLRSVLGDETAFRWSPRAKSTLNDLQRSFESGKPASMIGVIPRSAAQRPESRGPIRWRRTFYTSSSALQVAGIETDTSRPLESWPYTICSQQHERSPEHSVRRNAGTEQSNEGCVDPQVDPSPISQDSPTPSVQGSSKSNLDGIHDEEANLTFTLSKTNAEDDGSTVNKPAAQFWKYNLYVDLSGKPPSRHYCTTYEQAESQAAHFLNIPVVGFDLEWDSRAIAGKSDIKRLVSLIQVASETRIGLFQVSLFRGTKGEDLVPPTLRKILESPSIIKAGVNVAGDATRMSKYLGVEMRGLFELSHLYKLVNYPRFPLNKRLVGLAAIVQDEFSMPLSKDEVRVSNWAQKLDNEQIDYACSDAYAGFQLFHSLESKRRKMDPRPPRPAFYELRLPLVLPDGTTVQPKAHVKSQTEPATEDVEEDDDEFVDALESQEEFALAPESNDPDPHPAGVIQDTTDGAMQGNDSVGHSASGMSGGVRTARHNIGPSASVSLQIQEADEWIAEFRASLPDGHGCKSGDKKQSVFRTYHIWHVQGFDITSTAAVQRKPPFSKATVASYILQAISEADLPFDPARIREPIEVLPPGARSRYHRIIARVADSNAA